MVNFSLTGKKKRQDQKPEDEKYSIDYKKGQKDSINKLIDIMLADKGPYQIEDLNRYSKESRQIIVDLMIANELMMLRKTIENKGKI